MPFELYNPKVAPSVEPFHLSSTAYHTFANAPATLPPPEPMICQVKSMTAKTAPHDHSCPVKRPAWRRLIDIHRLVDIYMSNRTM